MADRTVRLAALVLTLAIAGCSPSPARFDGSPLPRGTALPPPGLTAAGR